MIKALFLSLFFGMIIGNLNASKAMAQSHSHANDWLFFDLGEVIVTGNPSAGYHYVPGVLNYLEAARQAGYKTALITNIPEAWGSSCDLKFAGLQDFLGSRLHEELAFNWQLFDAVVMPPFDRYRKPHRFMFLNALSLGCNGRALFVGENQSEVATAGSLGFATYAAPINSTPYPSLSQVETLLNTGFHFEQPAACDFMPLLTQVLDPTDLPNGIDGCTINP